METNKLMLLDITKSGSERGLGCFKHRFHPHIGEYLCVDDNIYQIVRIDQQLLRCDNTASLSEKLEVYVKPLGNHLDLVDDY